MSKIYEVVLDRDMYQYHLELIDWLTLFHGPGFLYHVDPEKDCKWGAQTVFGTYFFMFKEKELAMEFIQVLENEYDCHTYRYGEFDGTN